MDSERVERLAHVAEMYFINGLTQAQIAAQLGYSRSMISRLLAEAQQHRIVEIRIHHPLERRPDLEQALIDQFGLKLARVLARGTLDHATMLRRLGTLAAGLLEDVVTDHMTIGVSWGTGVAELVNHLRPRPYCDIHVVQLIGALGTPTPEIDGPELARRLAHIFGGRYSILPVPLFVDSQTTRDALFNDPQVQRVLAHTGDMQLALVGIGTLEPDSASLVRAGYLSVAQVMNLACAGAVGDVCAIHFDLHGRLVETALTRRMIGVDAKALRAIPTRLAIAGGEAKAGPIVGACQAGFVNVLVTDEIAASGALRAAQEAKNL